MSTNKTQNYALHAWGLQDEMPLGEVNENFVKLDAALKAGLSAVESSVGQKAEIVVGSYTGDGADDRKINLGFTPRLVFVISETADLHNGAYYYGGLALRGQASQAVAVVEDGFSVRYYAGSGYVLISNGRDQEYFYFALR